MLSKYTSTPELILNISKERKLSVPEKVTKAQTAIKSLSMELPFSIRIDNDSIVIEFTRQLGRLQAEEVISELEELLPGVSCTALDRSKTRVTVFGVL